MALPLFGKAALSCGNVMADWKFYGRRGQLADRSFGNDPIRDDTLGLSLAPIDAFLFEARLNDAIIPSGTRRHRLTRSHRRRRVGVQPTSSNVARCRSRNPLGDTKTFPFTAQKPRVGCMPLLDRSGSSSAERRCAFHHKFDGRGLTMLCC